METSLARMKLHGRILISPFSVCQRVPTNRLGHHRVSGLYRVQGFGLGASCPGARHVLH